MRTALTSLLALVCISFLCNAQKVETVIQRGHTYEIDVFDISQDSAYLVTGSYDATARIWEMSSGRLLRTLDMDPQHFFSDVRFSDDGKQIVGTCSMSSMLNQWLYIWDTATGALIYSGKFDVATEKAHIIGSYLIIHGTGDISTFDLKTKKPIKGQTNFDDNGSLRISNDGKWMALVQKKTGEEEMIEVYHLPELTLAYKVATDNFRNHTSVTFDSSNKRLYALGQYGPLKTIDLSTGKVLNSYKTRIKEAGDGFLYNDFLVSRDGKTALIGTRENQYYGVFILETGTGKQIGHVKVPVEGRVNHISFAPAGNSILVSTNEKFRVTEYDFQSQKIRDLATGPEMDEEERFFVFGGGPSIHSLQWFMDYVNPIAFASSGRSMIKGRFGSHAKLWDITTGKTQLDFAAHQKSLFCFDQSPDGTQLVTGGGDGKLILWDLKTGDTLKTIKAFYRGAVMNVQFNKQNPDQVLSSRTYVAGMSDQVTEVKIHSVKTGRELKTLTFPKPKNHAAWNHIVVWGIEDSYLFHASDSTIRVLETRTGQVLRELKGHQKNISFLSLSADKKTLLSTSWDGTVCTWDTETSLLNERFIGMKGKVHQAVLSKDGKKVYAVGANGLGVWTVPAKSSGWLKEPVQLDKMLAKHTDMVSITIDPEGSLLATYRRDGAIQFWDLKSETGFFEHDWLTNDDWIVQSPEGYFSATDRARESIHFVDGMKSYSLDQFFDEFFRPDLVPQLFKNRGGTSSKSKLQGKLMNAPPPDVKIRVFPVDDNKGEIHFKVTDMGGGVASVQLFHNGKNITPGGNNWRFPQKKDESQAYTHVVDLVGGPNSFAVVATNTEKLESERATANVNSDVVSKNSTCYVLSVGINKYKNSKMDLNYARADAEAFGKLIAGESTLFKSVELIEIYDSDATKANIIQKLDGIIAKAGQEDVFVFYYAGHGSMVDNRFYFLPTESARLYDAQDLKSSAIDAALLQDKLKQLKCLKQLIVMDACQSGASVELLATRGAVEEKALAQLSRSSGVHVMASAGSEQVAAEFVALRHGVFTYVLMKALGGEADGAPKDGKITIYELKSYIDDQVPEMTRKMMGKAQYPYTFSRGHDFPIVMD